MTSKWIFLIDVVDFKKGEVVEVDEYHNLKLNDADRRDDRILIGMKSIILEECIIPLAEWRNKQIDKILEDE
jgi:small nuclear ribonucleoprotein (snRNP)-like protein